MEVLEAKNQLFSPKLCSVRIFRIGSSNGLSKYCNNCWIELPQGAKDNAQKFNSFEIVGNYSVLSIYDQKAKELVIKKSVLFNNLTQRLLG